MTLLIKKDMPNSQKSIRTLLGSIKNAIFENIVHNAKLGDKLFLARSIQFFEYQIQKIFNMPNPRYRSNDALKKISEKFSGDILNASGWLDLDKQGKTYKDYFPKANSYTLSNYSGNKGRRNGHNEIFLDLENDLPSNLKEKFDVVYNHTTLEHIKNNNQALQNLIDLSKDIIIIIVPFAQDYHRSDTFGDYHRFSPTGLKNIIENKGLKVISCNDNRDNSGTIYVIMTATKNPSKRQWIGPSYSFNREKDEDIFTYAANNLQGQHMLNYH